MSQSSASLGLVRARMSTYGVSPAVSTLTEASARRATSASCQAGVNGAGGHSPPHRQPRNVPRHWW
ncbi:hypothetical protein [Streptomyces sp. NBC_01187]|uniref:hypothetical protein n=1 Tax=Streptomyces sp. NBC_01187 TaxID=2903766 RepID=UPI00386E86C8|nr:hypothetical protein OG220_39150 [Streptomyces sp. NBC_01187]